MSAQIRQEGNDYYEVLERTQKGTLDEERGWTSPIWFERPALVGPDRGTDARVGATRPLDRRLCIGVLRATM